MVASTLAMTKKKPTMVAGAQWNQRPPLRPVPRLASHWEVMMPMP